MMIIEDWYDNRRLIEERKELSNEKWGKPTDYIEEEEREEGIMYPLGRNLSVAGERKRGGTS